jgi:hypothetical protein
MIRTLLSLFFIIAITNIAYGQLKKDYEALIISFESIDYNEVISISNSVLNSYSAIPADTLKSIHEMRAVALFALGENDLARNDFIEILKIDSDYTPDPLIISPKIIAFFNPIKAEFNNIIEFSENNSRQVDSSKFIPVSSFNQNLYNNSIFRSILIPGLGHLHAGSKLKGITLTALSGLLIGSSAYFIIRTNELQKEYASQSEPDEIRAKYDEYNTSFKIRNALLISYALLWIYTQIDLLFFSSSLFRETIQIQIAGIPGSYLTDMSLSFSIPLN